VLDAGEERRGSSSTVVTSQIEPGFCQAMIVARRHG
jgi:hypothetical protein